MCATSAERVEFEDTLSIQIPKVTETNSSVAFYIRIGYALPYTPCVKRRYLNRCSVSTKTSATRPGVDHVSLFQLPGPLHAAFKSNTNHQFLAYML